MSDSSSRKYPLSNSSSLLAASITGNSSAPGHAPLTSCGEPQSPTATVSEDRLQDLAYCIRFPSDIWVEAGLYNLRDPRIQGHRGISEANLGGADGPIRILCVAIKETSRVCSRHRRVICEATAIYLTELSTAQPMKGAMNAIICAEQECGHRLDDDRGGIFEGKGRVQRRLLTRQEATSQLQLSDEQFQLLINTRQITVIRITGEERFDSCDLDQLIDSYRATAARRPQ